MGVLPGQGGTDDDRRPSPGERPEAAVHRPHGSHMETTSGMPAPHVGNRILADPEEHPHQDPLPLIYRGTTQMTLYQPGKTIIINENPVKNVTRIFDGSLIENEPKSDGNPIIFLANAMKIP